MSEFNSFCKKVKKTAAKVAKKTGEAADMAVKYVKLQKIDSKLSDRYEMLGRLTYKQLKTGESYAGCCTQCFPPYLQLSPLFLPRWAFPAWNQTWAPPFVRAWFSLWLG